MQNALLILDDDESIREILEDMMNDLLGNVKILLASSVAEAKEVYNKHLNEIKAILSDYSMPLENGIDFKLWLNAQNSLIPFYLMTGQSEENIANYKAAKVDFVFSKPFDVDEIIRVIKKHF